MTPLEQVRAGGRVAVSSLLVALLAACGGGSGGSFTGVAATSATQADTSVNAPSDTPVDPPAPPSSAHTLGGTVDGLAFDGLMLKNGADVLALAQGSTSFRMPGAVSYGSAYELGVQAQPLWGRCSVSNGAGVVRSDVSDVAVACGPWAPVTTLAGGLAQGAADGTGSEASFYWPRSMARSPNGDLYIGDTANYVIRKVTATGVVTTVPNGGCVNPTGLTFDSDGNLYVLDPYAHKICKITPAGVSSTVIIDQAYATSVVVDRAGNLYVSEPNGRVIKKISPSGEISVFAGQLGVAGDQDGTGTAAGFRTPIAMSIDKDDNIYLADLYRIRKITPQAVVTTVANSANESGAADGPALSASFSQAEGLAVADDGTIYVSDAGNNRIRMISPSGVVSTLAGSDEGQADGNGTAAKFNYPQAIVVDPSGALYVADCFNNAIRKISP